MPSIPDRYHKPKSLSSSNGDRRVYTGNGQSHKRQTVWSGTDLLAADLPEPSCVVGTVLTEGFNILVSRPKLGKSWLALQWSISVATGRQFADWNVLVGDVLYLALEDNARRLKNRLGKLLRESNDATLDRLTLATEWPRMDNGGMDHLNTWVGRVDNPRLIVIDTLARVRPIKARLADRYRDDYQDVSELQQLADAHHIAILCIHHDRKAQADDAMDDVSGSIGITGAADTILLLRRERGQHDACLHVHGRDVEEQEHGLLWAPQQCRWTVAQEAVNVLRMSNERRAVLNCVREHGSITPQEIGKQLKKKDGTVRKMVKALADDGEIQRDVIGRYSVPPRYTGNDGNAVTQMS